MKRPELKKAYEGFFLKNEAGQHFVQSLQQVESQLIADAKNDPESSRDLMQQARGLDRVVAVINAVIVEPKKEGSKKQK